MSARLVVTSVDPHKSGEHGHFTASVQDIKAGTKIYIRPPCRHKNLVTVPAHVTRIAFRCGCDAHRPVIAPTVAPAAAQSAAPTAASREYTPSPRAQKTRELTKEAYDALEANEKADKLKKGALVVTLLRELTERKARNREMHVFAATLGAAAREAESQCDGMVPDEWVKDIVALRAAHAVMQDECASDLSQIKRMSKFTRQHAKELESQLERRAGESPLINSRKEAVRRGGRSAVALTTDGQDTEAVERVRPASTVPCGKGGRKGGRKTRAQARSPTAEELAAAEALAIRRADEVAAELLREEQAQIAEKRRQRDKAKKVRFSQGSDVEPSVTADSSASDFSAGEEEDDIVMQLANVAMRKSSALSSAPPTRPALPAARLGNRGLPKTIMPSPAVEALVRDDLHGMVSKLGDAWPAASAYMDSLRREAGSKADVRLSLRVRPCAVGSLMGRVGSTVRRLRTVHPHVVIECATGVRAEFESRRTIDLVGPPRAVCAVLDDMVVIFEEAEKQRRDFWDRQEETEGQTHHNGELLGSGSASVTT